MGRRRRRKRSGDADSWGALNEAARRGLVDQAVVDALRASQELPVVNLLETVGSIAIDRGDDRSAEELYRAAIEAGSTNPGVVYNLGNILARRECASEAVEYYGQAIALDPDMAIAFYNRGVQRRRLGDENGAVSDIATAIENGHDGLDAYAALLRGQAKELGEPGASLEHATASRQFYASGGTVMALQLAGFDTNARRAQVVSGRLADQVALVIALQNEMELRERLRDYPRASAIATELASLCSELALVDAAEWVGGLEVLRVFVVDQHPQRLTTMIELQAQAGRHDIALQAAAEAINCYGGPESPQLLPVYLALQNAVYLEIKKRARILVESQPPTG